MLNRRHLAIGLVAIGSAAIVMAGSTGFARAAVHAPFTPTAFAAAQQAGKAILVEITAPWCPTCKAQKPILSQLTAEPKFKDLAIFEVDFDSQKAIVRSLGANMQSTLISYSGGKEVGRSVGDTDPRSIAALLDKMI